MTEQERQELWQELEQKIDELDSALAEIDKKYESAMLDNDKYLALAYATEGEELAAMGYAYSQRLRDLVDPVGECPEAIKAVEEILESGND